MQCSRNYYIFTYTILSSSSAPLNHLLNIRYLVEYSVSHLIVRQNTRFSQIFYVFLANTAKVRQDCLVGQEFLVYFLQRDDFLHHVDTDLTSILA